MPSVPKYTPDVVLLYAVLDLYSLVVLIVNPPIVPPGACSVPEKYADVSSTRKFGKYMYHEPLFTFGFMK